MKKVKATTIKMYHRTIALLLLILTAFSSASCNTASKAENGDSQMIEQTEEEKKYSVRSAMPEDKVSEIKSRYDIKMVPRYHVFPAGEYSFKNGGLKLETYGMYGEACIIHAKESSFDVYWENIGGFEFRYRQAPPLVYYNQKFYELGEAVEKNIIYNGDLEIIHKEYKDKNYNPFYKWYLKYSVDSQFYGKSVYVTVQPPYNDKEYTVDDFAEIGCVAVEETTSFDFKTNPNRIGRKWQLHLGKESKEWAVQAIEMLYEREDVFLVQADHYNSFAIVPNDTEYSQGKQTELLKISMPSAWDIQSYATGIKVGIIDSGIEILPELEPNLNVLLSRSFDSDDSDPFSDTYGQGHGTKVASLIGAKSNNATGMAGICWDVQMVSLKVGLEGSQITEAVRYATENNIKVINCSMGRLGEKGFDLDEYKAISNFPGLFVCIAGNDGVDIDTVPYYPASYDLPNIIVVGASSTSSGKKWSLSSYGANTVDLFAPGQNIRVLTNTGSYEDSSGTSFAAPIVTGVVALMIAKYPDRTRYWIKDKLLDSVDVDTDAAFNFVGKCATGGHLNAYKALCPHDNPTEYSQETATMHFITCGCGYQGYMPHIYDTMGEKASSAEPLCLLQMRSIHS